MAIKTEKTQNVKISAKGILKNITAEGFVIEDEKDSDIDY